MEKVIVLKKKKDNIIVAGVGFSVSTVWKQRKVESYRKKSLSYNKKEKSEFYGKSPNCLRKDAI